MPRSQLGALRNDDGSVTLTLPDNDHANVVLQSLDAMLDAMEGHPDHERAQSIIMVLAAVTEVPKV